MSKRSELGGIRSLWLSHASVAAVDRALQTLESTTGRRLSRSAAIDYALGSLTRTQLLELVRACTGLPPRHRVRRIYSSHFRSVKRPILQYYGSKFKLAKLYPAPTYPLIIEPFAGGAGYSLMHHDDHEIWLNDTNDQVSDVWQYLTQASPERILSLPDTPEAPGLSQAERWLLGWRVGVASAYPRRRPTPWITTSKYGKYRWSDEARQYIANQLPHMRQWTVTDHDYRDLPDIEATWFIDPPYQGQYGARYRHGSRRIDYEALGEWCRSRRGQVIVCEAEGATWLPFTPLRGWTPRRSLNGSGTPSPTVREMIWTQGCDHESLVERVLGIG